MADDELPQGIERIPIALAVGGAPVQADHADEIGVFRNRRVELLAPPLAPTGVNVEDSHVQATGHIGTAETRFLENSLAPPGRHQYLLGPAQNHPLYLRDGPGVYRCPGIKGGSMPPILVEALAVEPGKNEVRGELNEVFVECRVSPAVIPVVG